VASHSFAAETISFVVTTLLGFYQTNALLRIVYRVSAIWLGVLSFTFFASVVCWFIYAPLMLFGCTLISD